MVFLHRPSSPASTKRPAPDRHQPSPPASASEEEGDDVATAVSVLAEAGCTVRDPLGRPPSLPSDHHRFRRLLESTLSSDPSLLSSFLSGFSSYLRLHLRRLLAPSSATDGRLSLARCLLLVPSVQPDLLRVLLELLPEHFGDGDSSVACLIVDHLRWLDFIVDPEALAERLMEVVSVCPPGLKKDIIGSIPEILGGGGCGRAASIVVPALEQLLHDDPSVSLAALDSLSDLHLDDNLQEQAVTMAISCIRTIDAEQMPQLIRFLLLSATAINAGRIVSQIREHLRFSSSALLDHRHKKHKGKYVADGGIDAVVLEALRSGLQFKNVLCEAILKELRSLDKPREHKAIDVWLLVLIHSNGGLLQKSTEKVIKRKIVDGCFQESLIGQCIQGYRELVQGYFPSFLAICEFLLACKERQVRDFGMYVYALLFEEFGDAYSRQEVLGALVAHIGSGVRYEVSSALETMKTLTSKYSQELIPFSSHISGILDYLEGFDDENLHKVYEVFSQLALSARSKADSFSSSIANELLMIVRKQVGNPDLKYKRMGIIGTLKIVSALGDINAITSFPSTQKTNSEEAIELLKMSLDSCKLTPLPFILFYDELTILLDCTTLQPSIMEWMGMHIGEFESMFLSDLEGGQLPHKDSSGGLQGELWMNLDGDLSPICLNILSLAFSSSQQQSSSSLQILPAQFQLLSVVERLTNRGSLGGIDALLGCPLHLPSDKHFNEATWKALTGKQKEIICLSIYYAINWIRELLNAFSTQVGGLVDCVTQATKETIAKLLKRLRNLFLERLLNSLLKIYPLTLPVLHSFVEPLEPAVLSKTNHMKYAGKKSEETKASGNASPNSRRKRKKSSMTPDNSDPNGKLRQPTILDALKRAGVHVSQEVANEGSSGPPSSGKKLQSEEHKLPDSNMLEPAELSGAAKIVDAQRFKFRPLLPHCFNILSFAENQDSCCSDPAAELSLHLYLLRDLHFKLNYLSPPSKQLPAACPAKALPCPHKLTVTELLNKITPQFPCLKKHLDVAICVIKEGSDACQEHWNSRSASSGNPDIPSLMISKSSVASSVIEEVLCCSSKILNLQELGNRTNMSILRDLLENFQPINKPDNLFADIQPFPSLGNMDYLYCGAYVFLEDVLETACSVSFLLASEVLVTLESLVNSVSGFVDKSLEGNGKNVHVEFSQGVLPFLRKKLGNTAHKLLVHEWNCIGQESGWNGKRNIIQKILHIYLQNSESTSDILDELACSILPQVFSCSVDTTQDIIRFPTLCPMTFLTWYKVLHEENLAILNKLVKKAILLRSRSDVQSVNGVLANLRKSVNVVVSLVNMCKTHEKVTLHAMSVKYGGKFVDSFLKVFDFLQAHFQAHNDAILQLVRELQKATRIIQTLCSEAKGSKRTMITSKIPATKRSMERFLFHVKGLLHSTSNGRAFWMGNLKHKDLMGQVVSSQVYNNDDEDSNNQGDADQEDPTGSHNLGVNDAD